MRTSRRDAAERTGHPLGHRAESVGVLAALPLVSQRQELTKPSRGNARIMNTVAVTVEHAGLAGADGLDFAPKKVQRRHGMLERDGRERAAQRTTGL
jgi:hypothetical protein